MNKARSHAWIDARSLALASAIARKLREDPAKLDVARENLRRWRQSLAPWPDALEQWETILRDNLETVITILTEDTQRGRRLRQSHPFAGILTVEERARIFQQYESISA